MRPFFSALSFLTTLPVPGWIHSDLTSLQKAGRWYPAVGALVGLICLVVIRLVSGHLSSLAISALALAAGTWLTGALHLDGLADMADGFGRKRSRENTLRIMRDHTIGAYGAIALFLALSLQLACLSELVTSGRAVAIVVIVPALSRWGILLSCRIAPYARRMDSSGSGALAMAITGRDFGIATILSLLLIPIDWTTVLACWLAVILVTFAVTRLAQSRIDGITGDTLGAAVILCETVEYLVSAWNVR